jgi:ABC-type transport system involved in multi-copper enzyme maturation permease subunit
MIARVAAVAWTGFLQLVRSRVYLNILVAGAGLIIAALAFDELSAGAGGRVLFDVGLSFISLVVAALSGTIAITAITRELETKQAHLVLARPISRSEFVVARFLTAALLVVLANAVLGALLAGLIVVVKGPNASLAFGACMFASFEGFILAAIATFFGVGSSSPMSAVFTTTLFVAGRLTTEMNGLIERGVFGPATPVVKAAYAVLPHLPAFDLSPMAHGVDLASSLPATAAYGVAYTAAFLVAAAIRFSRRDLL